MTAHLTGMKHLFQALKEEKANVGNTNEMQSFKVYSTAVLSQRRSKNR